MNLHVTTPFRIDRNLGKAYNDTFRLIGDDDWLCITDYDVLFLLPDTINNLYGYIERYPEADMFVSWANRTFHSNQQLYGGPVATSFHIPHDDVISNQIKIAREAQRDLYKVTRIQRTISGFLMVIPKRTWNEIKFVEDLKCLGVDSVFSQRMVDAGKTIYRMDGVYVWHTYRLENGVKYKSHLE